MLDAALTGMLMMAPQGDDTIVLRHDISPEYNSTEYESACGATVFRVRFRNSPGEHGRVDQLTINGRAVPGAAEQLDIRAARRVISRIGIMNCGIDPKRPIFRGVMHLSEIESQAASMRPLLFFRLAHEEGKGWQLSID